VSISYCGSMSVEAGTQSNLAADVGHWHSLRKGRP
jgi:hypothetical protein